MSTGVFVTGTDTGIGKTQVSCTLLRGLRSRQVNALGMKPVASGSRPTALGLRNDDAEALMDASGYLGDYGDVNPYDFGDPIAPHLAAHDCSTDISLERIGAAHARLAAGGHTVVVEGVGGWLAPLGARLMQADLVRALELPVILVVGMRLGCINHALLTARAIAADGCRLLGWIANRIDPDMLRFEDNVESIRQRIQVPLLGIVDHAGHSRANFPRPDPDLADAVLAELGRQSI